MKQAFSNLSDEFDASARSYNTREGKTSLSMLLQKYSVMQRHKVSDPAGKGALATSLFGCGMNVLEDIYAKKDDKSAFINTDETKTATTIFARLLDPDSVNYIPASAAATLADMALELMRKAENVDSKNFMNKFDCPDEKQTWEHKNGLSAFAEVALTFADKFREAVNMGIANVETSQSFQACKPLVLKQPASPA
ncbi:MAG: hypothetical protein EPN97_18540 [Alphaproteobacteria bacterium]|nr:MAG: hypothetical protein EPN97_18540 [Alphaproteobacteria bacterium]